MVAERLACELGGGKLVDRLAEGLREGDNAARLPVLGGELVEVLLHRLGLLVALLDALEAGLERAGEAEVGVAGGVGAAQLGARRGLYRTADSVADIEALREQAGYARLTIYAVSYGTKVALAYAAAHPDRIVAVQAKEQRVGRVMIDWSQNHPAKSTATPYSLRGKPDGPTVAAPRAWDEIGEGMTQLTPDAVLDRLERDGDPMERYGLA